MIEKLKQRRFARLKNIQQCRFAIIRIKMAVFLKSSRVLMQEEAAPF